MAGSSKKTRSLRVLCLTVICACPFAMLHGQSKQPKSYSIVPDEATANRALSKLRAGDATGYDIGLIGLARKVEAVPELERKFVRATETLDKAKIAQVLVQFRDKDDTYWNYLLALVMPILSSDEPHPILYDSKGKDIPGLAPDFEAWAKENNKDVEEAYENATLIEPGELSLLASTEDPRAIPLLRKALESRNHLIEAAAAEGLAAFQDKDSIPSIIQAAGKGTGIGSESDCRVTRLF